ncbi:RNase H-like domain-containing protein, partial [Xanthomonadaceae bacterium XH05]|nr:RNase H-like domain-containing protein [Xanthomonadaceae bacterium XH05]
KFVWTDNCESSFSKLKAILLSQPVLATPNFAKPFKMAVDASDTGAGAVLLQEDDQGIEHPVSYYSKKFTPPQKNYSTIEKELLALILGLQHFSFYLCSGFDPIVIYTDHNPL